MKAPLHTPPERSERSQRKAEIRASYLADCRAQQVVGETVMKQRWRESVTRNREQQQRELLGGERTELVAWCEAEAEKAKVRAAGEAS